MAQVEEITPTVYLPPGGLYVAERPTIVSTILGSCVSVCIWSPRLKAGGVCHAMLPKRSMSSVLPVKEEETFKFVDCAVAGLIKRFEAMGADTEGLHVKLFGGSNMFNLNDEDTALLETVGRQNIKAAVEIIESFNLNLVASDVGGHSGRKIKFLTHTGAVFMQYISRNFEREMYLQPAW
jgi:chemotaxis protein CheD